MKKTLVVNMIGSPGAGKSTTMAGVFYELKNRNIDCEMVTEFAKDLVWEKRDETFKNELYIFAKQHHRLFRLNGKVDVIVTDRPLVLTKFYNDKYGNGRFGVLSELAVEQANSFKSLNIFLERGKKYNPNGRNQTEEESDRFSDEIKEMLDSEGIPYVKLLSGKSATDTIVDLVLDIINDELSEAI